MEPAFLIVRAGATARKGSPAPLPDRSAGSYLLPMTRFRRLAVIFALPLLLASCGSTQPGPDPGPGRIIFTRLGNGLVDIYAMDVNGHDLQLLTTSYAFDDWGNWSRDTFKIVFQSDGIPDTSYTPRFQIYVMNSDGSNVGQLTFADTARDSLTGHIKDTTSNFHPAWSLDGTRIAFQSDRQTAYAVWVMNADGSNPVRLTDPSTSAGAPSWSPDGTRIAYEQDGDIWVMNADGSRKIRITSGFWSDRLPRWRPIL